MPRRRVIDFAAVDALVRERESVVSHADLMGVGLPRSTICQRILPCGPWQRIFPGVVITHSGTPTHRERLLGALSFVGRDAVFTGLTALAIWGVPVPRGQHAIHLLIPHERRRQSHFGLLVERSRSVEGRHRSGLPLATVARAVVDACRRLTTTDDVRAVVAAAVQRGSCTVSELELALRHAARQRTALPRRVLSEIAAGARSVAEARVREVFARRGVPQPRWNWSLHDADDGTHVVTPDAWWEHIGAALQIDSMAFHLSPGDYRRTQLLQRLMGMHDVPFLPVAPTDVLSDEDGFVRQVRTFLATHQHHEPTTTLVARPPADRRPR